MKLFRMKAMIEKDLPKVVTWKEMHEILKFYDDIAKEQMKKSVYNYVRDWKEGKSDFYKDITRRPRKKD